jgi:hypothetical protein
LHGRTRLLGLIVVAAALMPASASAAPIPPGTYDVLLSNGTVKLGTLLPPMAIGLPVSFPVEIGSAPVTKSIDVTVPDATIMAGGYSVTVQTTIAGASATVDPVAQSASVDVSLYTSLSFAGGSCSFGSAGAPIALHLTSEAGKPWDATTGLFGLADKTFALPTPSCSSGLLGGLVGLVIGSTGSGNNLASIDGLATRSPDPPATTPPGATTQPGGTTQPAVTGTDTTTITTVQRPPACFVPKVVGKSLAAGKRLLRKAGCKFRVVKAKKSKKRKGKIIAQGRKKGTSVPVGTVVKLTVSPGPPKARKRH